MWSLMMVMRLQVASATKSHDLPAILMHSMPMRTDKRPQCQLLRTSNGQEYDEGPMWHTSQQYDEATILYTAHDAHFGSRVHIRTL